MLVDVLFGNCLLIKQLTYVKFYQVFMLECFDMKLLPLVQQYTVLRLMFYTHVRTFLGQ